MNSSEGELRQWATHGILSICVKQHAKVQAEMMKPDFKEGLKQASEDDWSKWAANEAAELEAMIDLMK